MTLEGFRLAYANLPIQRRFRKFAMKEKIDYISPTCLADCYLFVEDIEKEIAKSRARQDRLIKIAEKYLCSN